MLWFVLFITFIKKKNKNLCCFHEQLPVVMSGWYHKVADL